MLNLNIKSSSYMCLDIDPYSRINEHLIKKLTNLNSFYTEYDECGHEYMVTHNPVIGDKIDTVSERSIHRLTMLPSFHISLGAPPTTSTPLGIYELDIPIVKDHLHQLIGGIALADIHISEHKKYEIDNVHSDFSIPDIKDKLIIKKSAFIKLPKSIIPRLIIPEYFGFELINEGFKNLITNRNQYHISLANLTGNPRDSIGHPESCIIDTITA